jgi:hypothetical protein
MAKRFTDTHKYKKPFIRSLPGPYKLLWDFLYHDCDHAGIWILDLQIAQTYIGHDMPIDPKKALELFNTPEEQRIVEIDNGKKWFIPSFIEFQYGHLSEKNRAHLNVISILKKFGLLNDDLTLKKIFKPLTRPLQGAKEQEKEQEKEMEQEKEQEPKGGMGEKLIVQEMRDIWIKNKPDYPEDAKKDSPALQSIAKFISEKLKIPYQPRDGDTSEKILESWSVISEFVSVDGFYKNWSLKQVENNLQSIIQKIQHGKAGSKNGSASGSKVTSEQLNASFTKFRSGEKSARSG